MSEADAQVATTEIALDRDRFMRTLIRHLAGTLEDVVGVAEAEGFISVVGQNMGEEIDAGYRRALRVERLSREQVSAALVDLKRRIDGDFYVLEEREDAIVLGNRRCPFGDKVIGRPSMCMMTSNVFGVLAAENLGYARVVLEQTIANGDPGCRVTVYVKPQAEQEGQAGREYVRAE
jgi:hypothetical protein